MKPSLALLKYFLGLASPPPTKPPSQTTVADSYQAAAEKFHAQLAAQLTANPLAGLGSPSSKHVHAVSLDFVGLWDLGYLYLRGRN